MAKTALNQLQDQIEAIRREAYAAGYAAAMEAIRDFAGRPAAAAPAARRGRTPAVARRGRTPAAAAAPKPAPQRGPQRGPRRRRAAAAKAPAAGGRRPQRGTNARLIAEVLKAMPSGTARPAEIRTALQRDKGVQMAFTSIRHALGQLAARNEVAASADGKTWRYTGASA
jgi:hypothetical protein